MKKVIAYLLIIGMILSFNINVKAEEETKTGNETTESETGTETKENEGSTTGESGKTDETKPSEDDKLKSDATLKNITINGVKVVCTNFVCEYIVSDNETKSVKVEYSLTNSKASVDPKSGFTKEIKEGTTEFDVKVTSEDKSKNNTYKFKITKKVLSTDSTLKRLVVNGKEITLKEGEQKYTASVSFSTKKIEIEAVPNNEKTKVLDFKNNKASFDFFNNSKEIKIKVQSEAGDMVTYTVTVTKRSEADVTLKSLTIKNYDIDFDSEVNEYEIKVLKNVDKLDIKAVANDSKADVKITNPKLSVGEQEVKIEVTNDGNTNEYIIKVTKLNEDDKTLANLKSLTIEKYELDFKTDKYEYDLKIDESDNYLVIKALPKLSDADVEITGNLDLENGSIIKIKVTYDDEFYNVYKINIVKDGTMVSKLEFSTKGAIIVIIFDILSIITIGIVQFVNRNKKNKDSDSNNSNNNNDNNNLNNKVSVKENNLVNNLDDVIDII